ncbi:MAG: ABC transporter permease [Proteobacteria bacterium]|nr:ABC transporter permease [Pseudomonadota bacterium]
MTFGRELRLALTLARRELRSGVRGFGIFLACLTIGVGAMSTVGLMTASLKAGLAADAAKILGGDLVVSLSHRPAPAEAVALLDQRGQVAEYVAMRTMARTDETAALTEIKAVGPGYPLYGGVVLASGRSLEEAFSQNTSPAILASDLLDRLGAKVGDEISLGTARFTVVDQLVKEPDQSSGIYGFRPRTLIPLDRLEATDLLVPGAITTYAYAWKAAPGSDMEAMRQELNTAFPDEGWRIQDLSSAGGGLGRFLDYLGLDLSLVALATLLLGGIGVAGGVAGHLARRDITIAAMKCLGASRRTVQATYLFQILFLAGLGCCIGLGVGAAIASTLCSLLAGALQLPVRFGLYLEPVTSALAYGMLTALVFSIWPLSAAARTTPARLFTGYADPGRRRPSRRAVGAVVLCGLALFCLSYFTAHDTRITLGFAGALLVGSLAFLLLAQTIRLLAARCRRPKDPRFALAISNLHRPGSSTTSTILSLGFGLAVLACVALVESNLRDNVERIMPATAPSYFFVNVRASDWDKFQDTVRSVPGVSRLEATPVIRGRITGLGGQEADPAKVAEESAWALRGDRFLTFAGDLPANSRISAGQWWPKDYAGPPLVSLEQGLATGFGVDIGDTMTFNVLGRSITAEISNLRQVDWTTLQLNQAVVLSPGILEKAPYTWLASVHATPEAEKPLFRAVTAKFPDAVVVYVKDILTDVSRILGHVGLAAGSAAGLTLLVGLLILGEAVRGTLRTRRYDLVVFKVFGATRRDVLTALSAEFLLLGSCTALIAAALGCLGAWLFVTMLLKLTWSLDLIRLAEVTLGGVAVIVALGLVGVRRVLSQKAWPLLRND